MMRGQANPIEFIDCTLRDGEQAPGVWFTIEEKVAIAGLLDRAGVDALDAGFPGANGEDLEAMQEMRRQVRRARIGATARPLLEDIRAAETARADDIYLFLPTSRERLEEVLGTTAGSAADHLVDAAGEAAGRGMGVNIVFEDATRSNLDALLRLAGDILSRTRIERLILCDTVGAATPTMMQRLFDAFASAFGSEAALCPHCHNDFGLATANTLAAVEAGAVAVTCTVNGLGERAGNADLAEVAAALTVIHGREHRVLPESLPALSESVARASGVHMSPLKPVTGYNVYRHESGIHVQAMLKRRDSYEYLPADWSGRDSEFVLGKHSGSALIRHLLVARGIEPGGEEVAAVLKALKELYGAVEKPGHGDAFRETEAAKARLLAGADFDALLARAGLASGAPRGEARTTK